MTSSPADALCCSKAFATALLVASCIIPLLSSASVAADPLHPSVTAIESWFQEMEQHFEDHPELKEQRGSGWMPYSRAKWFTDQRRVDGQLPDPRDRWRAWEEKRAIERTLFGNPADPEGAHASHAAGAGWFQLGPTNMSGRIIAIAVHPEDPSIVYIGGAGGGLWKTTDAGDTWIPLTDFLPALAIGGIAILPSDPDVILIGTGEGTGTHGGLYGVGIFKSTDAGMSWSPTGLSLPPASLSGFHRIEVNPITGVLLAGANVGLYRSSDAGDTWTQIYIGHWSDIEWKPGDPSRVYAARMYGGSLSGIWASDDGGLTWAKAGTGQPATNLVDKTRLSISAAAPSTVYAHIADRNTWGTLGIYRSTDDGATWEIRNDTINMLGGQGNYSISLVADPDDPDHLISGGVYFYESTDAGLTWTRTDYGDPLGSATNPHVDHHVALYEPGSTTNLWIGTDGGVWRSTDDGASWLSRREGLVTYQFYDIGVAQSDPFFMMGGTQDNGIPGREGIDTWFQSTLTADGMVTHISPDNADEIYSEWQSGRHVKSTNGGQSWFNIQNGIQGLGLFVTPVDQDPQDSDHLYTSAYSGLYRTTNGGSLWQQVGDADHAADWLSISPVDGDVIWTVSRTATLYSTNDGASWNDAAPYPFPTGGVLKILAHPTDVSSVLVTFGGYQGRAHVALSEDMGATWTDVTGDLPDMPVNAIAVDPDAPTRWFVGAEVGVWWTEDGGAHWLPYGFGLPNAVFTDLEIHRSARKLVAGSYGRGVWEADLPATTSVGEGTDWNLGHRLMLDPPRGNPVRARTSLRFAARSTDRVSLEVFDVMGRLVDRVATLPRGDAIVRVVEWDTSARESGTYFVTLRSGADRLTRRLVVVH